MDAQLRVGLQWLSPNRVEEQKMNKVNYEWGEPARCSSDGCCGDGGEEAGQVADAAERDARDATRRRPMYPVLLIGT